MLDAAGWSAADVLLFGAEGAGPFSQVIALVQRRHFPEHSQWTHAALYIGDGQLIEAVRAGDARVVQRTITSCDTHRPVLRLHHPALSDDERREIVSTASEFIGTPYGDVRAVEVGLHLLLGPEPAGFDPETDKRREETRIAVVCSDVVYQAYGYAGITAITTRGAPCPAALAQSDVFQQHAVTLCQVT